MLPTDEAMEHGTKCNIIQNALQKVDVNLDFEQAAIILIEIEREFSALSRLRRRKKIESGKKDKQQIEDEVK